MSGKKGLLMIINLHILHVKVILMVLLSGDAAASVAELAEGVVQIAAIETHPVKIVALTLGLTLFHLIEKIEQILFNTLMFKFILLSHRNDHPTNILTI
jgi:hypothetical protein